MRLQECKDNLAELLGEELLASVPLLVFANKQDLEIALDAGEVSVPRPCRLTGLLSVGDVQLGPRSYLR